jgi:hypothetical protein
MLVIWTNGEAWAQMSQEEQQGLFAEYFQYTQWLMDKGWFVAGDPLEPQAKTVRVRDGETQVTDGPYAETKEQLGSVYLVDCADAAAALALARRMPASPGLTVEIREIVEV